MVVYLIESTLSISEPSKFSNGSIVRIFLRESTIDLHFAGLNDKRLHRLRTPRESSHCVEEQCNLAQCGSFDTKLCHQHIIVLALSLQTGPHH